MANAHIYYHDGKRVTLEWILSTYGPLTGGCEIMRAMQIAAGLPRNDSSYDSSTKIVTGWVRRDKVNSISKTVKEWVRYDTEK